jgi:cytochrome P450
LTLNTPYDDQNRHDEDKTPMTDQEIRATLMEVCAAGTDTVCFVYVF